MVLDKSDLGTQPSIHDASNNPKDRCVLHYWLRVACPARPYTVGCSSPSPDPQVPSVTNQTWPLLGFLIPITYPPQILPKVSLTLRALPLPSCAPIPFTVFRPSITTLFPLIFVIPRLIFLTEQKNLTFTITYSLGSILLEWGFSGCFWPLPTLVTQYYLSIAEEF